MTARACWLRPVIACLLLTFMTAHVLGQGSSQPGWQCQIPGSGAFFGLGEKECVPLPGDCNPVNANLNGTVVVLDVNSLQYSGGPNHPPAVTTAKQCCDECRSDPRCNAWSFCWKEGGCGPHCDPAATGQGKPPGQRDLTREFGGCAPGNKWPRFMCILKSIPDPSPGGPRVYLPSGEDWASGVINRAAATGTPTGGSTGSGSTSTPGSSGPGGGNAATVLGACKTVGNRNYQGETVVFDVNSWEYNAGPNHPQKVSSLGDCCKACQENAAAGRGCNTFVYCGQAGGCGSGCSYAPPGASQDRTKWGPFGSCAAGGRYPQSFCGLKISADPSKPAAYPGDQGGFDSGTLS